MADQDGVRRIAMSLPDASEAEGHFAFSVRNGKQDKDFAWVWLERTAPKKARVPRPGVLAVRLANTADKELLLASDATKFFSEPHYSGFPAVLVRLAAIDDDELEELLVDAWRCQAPRALVAEFDRRRDR